MPSPPALEAADRLRARYVLNLARGSLPLAILDFDQGLLGPTETAVSFRYQKTSGCHVVVVETARTVDRPWCRRQVILEREPTRTLLAAAIDLACRRIARGDCGKGRGVGREVVYERDQKRLAEHARARGR